MPDKFMLGVALSERPLSENDCEMDVATEQVARETRTAAGALYRDLVATKRRWRFAYSWLPAQRERVFDGGLSRDELWALYQAGGSLSFKIARCNAIPEQTYVMFGLGSYSEKLLLRDAAEGDVYAVSFELVEE
jgi:hypothetical protein